jgi:hypothetical protein
MDKLELESEIKDLTDEITILNNKIKELKNLGCEIKIPNDQIIKSKKEKKLKKYKYQMRNLNNELQMLNDNIAEFEKKNVVACEYELDDELHRIQNLLMKFYSIDTTISNLKYYQCSIKDLNILIIDMQKKIILLKNEILITGEKYYNLVDLQNKLKKLKEIMKELDHLIDYKFETEEYIEKLKEEIILENVPIRNKDEIIKYKDEIETYFGNIEDYEHIKDEISILQEQIEQIQNSV